MDKVPDSRVQDSPGASSQLDLAGGLSISASMMAMRRFLAAAGDENPKVSASWIMQYVLGLDASGLIMYDDAAIDSNQVERLRECTLRRANGEPLQYITGMAPFRYLELKAKKGVFIPRPETEVLVDSVLDELRSLGFRMISGAPRILDLCCGSGTIAVSVASECKTANVVATDISSDAVALTLENARLAGVEDRVAVLEGSLYEPLEAALANEWSSGSVDHPGSSDSSRPDVSPSDEDPVGPEPAGPYFDIIASNPPYIPTYKLANMPEEVVDYEPMAALDGGEDGLDTFRKILSGAGDYLLPGGYLICELDEDTLENASKLCEDESCPVLFDSVRIIEDLTGRPRFIEARRSMDDGI